MADVPEEIDLMSGPNVAEQVDRPVRTTGPDQNVDSSTACSRSAPAGYSIRVEQAKARLTVPPPALSWRQLASQAITLLGVPAIGGAS
jgi:hypothetical protein